MLVTIDPARKPYRHSLDTAGLVLPDPSWPDVDGVDGTSTVSGALEPVRRFCNTTNRESGAEAWRTPTQLGDWLAREGHHVRRPTASDLERTITLREAIWTTVRDGTLAPLTAPLRGVALTIEVDADGIHFAGASQTIDAMFATLAGIIRDATADGSWARLKTCMHCEWMFFDTSNNCSGRWCTMRACGGREKARAYRRRRAAIG